MKSIFTCLLVSVALFVSAQRNTFKLHIFSTGLLPVKQVAQLNDGSFVSVGDRSNYQDGPLEEILLVKSDATGSSISARSLGNTVYDKGDAIVKTSDGGLVVGGMSSAGSITLIKCTASLDFSWQKVYYFGQDKGLTVSRVLQAADGGYLVTGTIGDYNVRGYAPFVMKTDGQGTLQFANIYTNYSLWQAADIKVTADGNYALLAATKNPDYNDSALLVKMKPDGSILWSKYLYGGRSVVAQGLLAASDGGYVVTGSYAIDTTTVVNGQLMMMKLNSTGDVVWSESMSTPGFSGSYATSITEDKDKGYVFWGQLSTYSFDDYSDYDTSYAYLVKTNASGAVQWTRTFDANFYERTRVHNVEPTIDGGYVMGGEGYYYRNDYNEYSIGGFLYKVDSSFNICGGTDSGVGTAVSRGFSLTAAMVANSLSVSTVDALPSGSSTSAVIQSACSSDALPVAFTSFDAELQGRSVVVKWTTANEINADRFVVERSADRTSFAALQRVAAKGNSASYSINDLQPLQGTSYYRLKEMDKDGKVTYSSIVPVTVMSNGTIVISPNPVQSVMHVIVQSIGSNNLTLQVVDMRGNVLATQNKAVGAGKNEIDMAASSLAKGVYILKVTDSKTTQAIRFVKE